MERIVIAYHGYMYGPHYMEMMTEQFRKFVIGTIHEDGTWERSLHTHCKKVYIGVVDSPDKKPEWGVEWIRRFWSFSSNKQKDRIDSKVEIVIYPDNSEETRTLKWIRDYSKDNPGDFVLYFHSNGISRYCKPTEDWRRYMEYFVIENWKDCIAKLREGCDCCGVMWNSDTPIGYHPHFSGNFWWARTDYINTLDHGYLDSKWRFDREFWIGSNPRAKVFEFHNSGLNNKRSLIEGKGHYDVEYGRENYVLPPAP